MSLMGIKEYARHRGVSPAAVRKAIAAGRITRRRDGKIDSRRADASWARNTDVSKPLNSVTGDPKHRRRGRFEEANPAVAGAAGKKKRGNGKPPADPGTPAAGNGNGNGADEPTGYAVHRAIREEYAAKTAELEYRQKLGELVEVDQVRREAFRAGRIARDLVLSLAPRLAPILAATEDEAEVHTLIDQAAREICEEIARLSSPKSAGQEELET